MPQGKKKLTSHQQLEIKRLHEAGLSQGEIGNVLGVSRQTINKYMQVTGENYTTATLQRALLSNQYAGAAKLGINFLIKHAIEVLINHVV